MPIKKFFTTGRENIWGQILTALLAGLLILLFMYVMGTLINNPDEPPVAGLAGGIVFAICIIIMSSLVSRHFHGIWKLFFLAIIIASSVRIIADTLLILFFYMPNIIHNPWYYYPYHIIRTFLFLSRPIYWTIFVTMAIRYSRDVKFKMVIPSLITTIAILLVMVKMAITFYLQYKQQDFSIWSITGATYDLLLFALLIYALPLAKNNTITLLIISYIIMVIGDILATTKDFTVKQYFNQIVVAHVFWVTGLCLTIYCLFMLLKKRNQNPKTWFYRIDSTHAQIVNWGNSIAALLFLLTGISYFMFPHLVKAMHDDYYINAIVFVPFITLLSLITLSLSRLFTRDYQKLDRYITKLSSEPESYSKDSTLYFSELETLRNFLKKQMALIAEKTAFENKLFLKAEQISQKIQQPLRTLSETSEHFTMQLTDKQRRVHQNALNRINAISKDISSLNESGTTNIRGHAGKQQKKAYTVAIIKELIQEKQLQYPSFQITINIDSHASQAISTIPQHDVYRIFANLIDNAIEASKNTTKKEITCNIECNPDEKKITIAIVDSGCGMRKQQIRDILARKSQSTKAGGHGIGLRYVITTLNKYCGYCHITSKINIGSCFKITLPIIKQAFGVDDD